MIVISRGLARAFRALARKCVNGRPRGPAPPVVFEGSAGTLTVWVRTADATLVYTVPAQCGDGLLVVPMAVLDAADGPGDDPVELAAGPGPTGEARWAEGGLPRAHPFDPLLPGKQHQAPTPPDDWHAAPPAFLAALHECGRTAAKEAGRFALTRVQVKGKAGQVVGTDGRTALVWGGFVLPLGADLLVPAVPVFGARELASRADVRVGRTPAHLVVAAGPWRVFLPVDAGGRFPDVAAVIPRHAPTVAGIDDRDAADLLARLPRLPGGDDEHRPVTLALDGGVAVRAADASTGAVEEVRLERSPSAGPPCAVAVDRRVLARALALGCVTVRASPDRPVVFEAADRTLVAAPLAPDLVARAGPETPPERSVAVTPHETNGRPTVGRPDPPAADPPDPLPAAEDLRAALADATNKAARLVAALKARSREKKALTQVWSSLKALNLGAGGPP